MFYFESILSGVLNVFFFFGEILLSSSICFFGVL